MMKLKPIKSDRELNRALKRIGELWGAKPSTPKGDELDVLMLIVEKYEEENYAIPASDPVEAIKFLMEQNSLSRKDLEPYIGASGRVCPTKRVLIVRATGIHRPLVTHPSLQCVDRLK
jgi:HTH-type transcriptional regulator/antitoxin HigA